MKITQAKQGDIAILEVAGHLDTNSSDILEAKFLALFGANENKIVVDFSELDFISSSGLRVLLMAAKNAKRAHGKIVLCTLKEHVKYVFDTAGFTMLFSMFATQEQAVRSF
jgi:anti-anti-sigma factor